MTCVDDYIITIWVRMVSTGSIDVTVLNGINENFAPLRFRAKQSWCHVFVTDDEDKGPLYSLCCVVSTEIAK